MDWLKAILKAAGLDDTKVDSIVGDAGKELPKHFVPKSQYNDVSDAKKQAEKDVADRDKQIQDLSKTAGLSDDLKKQIDQLQADNKSAKEKYEADLKDMTLNNAITSALNGKVHNEKHVTGLIDKEKLVIGDDGKVVGLEEQLKGLQTSDAYLFKTEDKGGGGGFKFKGTSLLDGKDQSKGEQGDDKVGSFGKQLAESTKGNEGLDTARESYFK
ncbi:phage scaffolding protein [Paenibacillus sp. FSL L8-0506]|uniref:phage scaffolding protein n=1 Tax=Paenibacillus sp. FSL L8-0506 TaxID=2975335 RepID=UPI0030F9130E